MNDSARKIEHANRVIDLHRDRAEVSPREATVDTITDLLHNMDREGCDPERVIEIAKAHWLAERQEPPCNCGLTSQKCPAHPDNVEIPKAHAEAAAAKITDAEQALTQVQHIAYDAWVAMDNTLSAPAGSLSIGQLRKLAVKGAWVLNRINEIAERGYPDEDFRRVLEDVDDSAEIPSDHGAGIRAARKLFGPFPEAGAMSTSDGLGGDFAERFNAAAKADEEARAGKIADLERVINGEGDLFSNDELLAIGVGYGVAGPLSNDQMVREATEILGALND